MERADECRPKVSAEIVVDDNLNFLSTTLTRGPWVAVLGGQVEWDVWSRNFNWDQSAPLRYGRVQLVE